MQSDLIIPGSIQFTDPNPVVEPVTLAYIKNYLRIGYDTDDALLTDLITAAREWVERRTGTSLIPRTVACTAEVHRSIELPYGPVVGAPTLVDGPVDGVTFTDGPFPRIGGLCGTYALSYSAGYDPVPTGLKMAIAARVGATYENRGDKDVANYSQVAKQHYLPFKRIVSWL